MELFFKDGVYSGFAGKISLKKKDVYVNTKNGEGYSEVLKCMNPFIKTVSNKFDFSSIGYSREDTEQYINLLLLEGIPTYDPRKKTNIVSYLSIRTRRLLINKLAKFGNKIRNPTMLRTTLYSCKCICGNYETIICSSEKELSINNCKWCNRPLSRSVYYKINQGPCSIGSGSGEDFDNVMEDNCYYSMVYGSRDLIDNKIIKNKDLNSWVSDEEQWMQSLVNLIINEDFSISGAARKVGISPAKAYNSLKDLKHRRKVKDFFNR